MKKSIFFCFFFIFFSVWYGYSQQVSYNPYVSQPNVNPAPLLPVQFNGTGVLSFNVGNTGSDPLDPAQHNGQTMSLTITISKGVPIGDPVTAALGGTWKDKFSWTYDAGIKTYSGVQIAVIPGASPGNPSQGNITIQYQVTVNSYFETTPNNGFNCNITPAAYMVGINATDDDAVSAYTFVVNKDFGDAPSSYGNAQHTITWETASTYVYMGSTVDPELALQSNSTATGDDIALTDDEDGVTIPTLYHGLTTNISVLTFVPGGSFAALYAWIDWNGDGDFIDAGESLGSTFTFGGLVSIPVSVPGTAKTSAPTYARFRISGGPISGPGDAASSGEAEDYMIQILSNSDVSVEKTGGSTFLPGTTTTYQFTVTNTGEKAYGVVVTDNAPAGTTITGWTASFSGDGSGNTAGSGNINETVTLAANGTAVYTVTVSVPCTYSQTELTNTVTVDAPTVNDPNLTNNTSYWTKYQNVWIGGTVGALTDWNTASNWSIGVPDCSTTGAVIPGTTTYKPVVNTKGNETANLVILDGATVTVNPDKELKVCGCTEINGPNALYLKSSAAGNSEFIPVGPVTYPNNGSARVELYLTSCVGQTIDLKCWHYVTSPVIEGDGLAGTFSGDKMKYYNEVTGQWSAFIEDPNTVLDVTKGYAVYANGSKVRTFHGRLNTGTIVTDPDLTRTETLGNGWNLIGNPYSSPIDLNSAGITWNNVEAKVYYLDQGAGNYKVFPSGTGYETGTRYPLSMQGFFVHVPAGSTGTVTFTDAARTFENGPYFYKNTLANVLKLKVEESSGMNDELVIGFRDDVTAGYDQQFDCSKAYGDLKAPQLYSVTPENNKLTINVLPFAGKNTTIPLEFFVSQNGAGDYQITASELESFKAGTIITLEDKKINKSQVLTDNPVYSFTYAQGEDPERFLLHFYNPYFGIEDIVNSNGLIVYSSTNNIYVKDLTEQGLRGQIKVYNLVGQVVAAGNLYGGNLNKFPMNLDQGYYLVEVLGDKSAYHGKVYLTR